MQENIGNVESYGIYPRMRENCYTYSHENFTLDMIREAMNNLFFSRDEELRYIRYMYEDGNFEYLGSNRTEQDDDQIIF